MLSLLFLFFAFSGQAETIVKEVDCSPLDPKTGRVDIAYTVETGTNDAPARLAGVVLDRASGRSLVRATLLGYPTGALAPGRHRVVWNALADAAFLPLDRVKLRLFAEPIVAEKETPAKDADVSTDLIYHCTFDSAEAVENPVVGPSGKFLGGEFVPGKFGAALSIFADEPAAEVDFKPGLLGPRGTIEFWAKKGASGNSAVADEGNLRFFGIWHHERGQTPRWCSTHLQFTSNDGMGMSGLCGMVNHCSWATNPSWGQNPYDLIQASLTDWHHYAVIWDIDGLSGTAASDGGPAVVEIFLDGKPVQTQGRQTTSFGRCLGEITSLWGKLAFPTPSNGWNSSGGHIPFLIDEFKIWSRPKSSFDLNISNVL